MLPLDDADKEEARYQQLAEPFKSAARATATSYSAPALDVSPSSILLNNSSRPPSERSQEACTITARSSTGHVNLTAMDVPEPPALSGQDVVEMRERQLFPNPKDDIRELSTIIELDGSGTPSSGTSPAATSPTGPQTTLHLEGHDQTLDHESNTASMVPPATSHNIGWEGAYRSGGPVRKDSGTTTSNSASGPSSPILSGSETSGSRTRRSQKAHRTRVLKGRFYSSVNSGTPSRQNTGEMGEGSNAPERCATTIRVEAPPEDELVPMLPPPDAVPSESGVGATAPPSVPAFSRDRTSMPNLGNSVTLSSLPGSIAPSRSSSPAAGITARIHPSIGAYLSRDDSLASSLGNVRPRDSYAYGSQVPPWPHSVPPGVPLVPIAAHDHVAQIHPSQSHPILYCDLPTALGLSRAPLLEQYAWMYPPVSHPPYAPSGGTVPNNDMHRRRPTGGTPDNQKVPAGQEEPASTLPPEPCHGSTRGVAWETFPLKIFRAKDFKVLEIQRHWDDEDLLMALKDTYDELRGWRKFFGLMGIGYITPVRADHSYIYPQRIGTPWISPHKNMRMRYLLHNPAHQRGQRQIMDALTRDVDVGVEFVERWKTRRLLGIAAICAVISYVIMVGWGARTGDWATASQMGQLHFSMFSLLFIAVAWSQNHEF